MPILLAQVISSVALSDTLCKAKFSLRLSRPSAARSCLQPADMDFPGDLLEVRGFLVIGEDSLHILLQHDCTMVAFAKREVSRLWLLSPVLL